MVNTAGASSGLKKQARRSILDLSRAVHLQCKFCNNAEAPLNTLMTTDEVADLLNVKPATIRKWVHLEQIPVVRLGRAVRFRADELGEWIDERSQKARTWD